jgi:hypothetical protein
MASEGGGGAPTAAAAFELTVGEPVRVRGLAQAAQHNGKVGAVKVFVPAKGRYKVQVLGMPRAISVRPANLLSLRAARVVDYGEDVSHSVQPQAASSGGAAGARAPRGTTTEAAECPICLTAKSDIEQLTHAMPKVNVGCPGACSACRTKILQTDGGCCPWCRDAAASVRIPPASAVQPGARHVIGSDYRRTFRGADLAPLARAGAQALLLARAGDLRNAARVLKV